MAIQCEDNKSVVTNDVLVPVHRINEGAIIDAKPLPQVQNWVQEKF